MTHCRICQPERPVVSETTGSPCRSIQLCAQGVAGSGVRFCDLMTLGAAYAAGTQICSTVVNASSFRLVHADLWRSAQL